MNNELQHFGVKGMKWGVRRYQNYDGTYTQKGLKRYRESQAKYDAAGDKLKAARASGDKAAIQSAKAERKNAKRNLKGDYRQIKKDYKADKGKNWYQQGYAIGDISKKYNGASGITGFATLIAARRVAANIMVENELGRQPFSSFGSISSAAVAAGLAGTTVALAAIKNKKVSELRAYYGHSRNARVGGTE